MKPVPRIIGALFLVMLLAAAASGRSLPEAADYGTVIMDNFSSRAGLAPVRFEHWLHRSKFTCRVCHVDVGFSMEAGATKVRADLNVKGFYCGSCHNGQVSAEGVKVFPACSTDPTSKATTECRRCHSGGSKVPENYDYASYTKDLPRQAWGDLVDWDEAEARGLINPADSIPGLASKRPPLSAQDDFSITSKGWMPNIIFSHKKHARWNGCEVCHPDIFPSVKKGAVKYSMFEISEGEYCGLCHDRVAFPLVDCARCHVDRAPK